MVLRPLTVKSLHYCLQRLAWNLLGRGVSLWYRIFNEMVEREPDEGLRRKGLLAMASAWYMVTYDRPKEQSTNQGRRLYSFPWVLNRHLSEIKKSRRSSK
jgi:hypothetical protein